MSTPIDAVLIGAGNRGAEVYGRWALRHPDRLIITAVAEPMEGRRLAVARKHGIPTARQFDTWEGLLAQPRLARAAIIATQDHMHTGPALAALKAGYDVLLEKPMAHRLADCVVLVQAAEQSGRVLQICHVLRYTAFAQRACEIIRSGQLGQIITISHRENVSSGHMAHSFVRGNWRSAAQSSPMILAKSCHDLDLLHWFLDSRPVRLSSYGALRHFRAENAPPGAPDTCLEGCPAEDSCPFYAPAFYIDLLPFKYGLGQARHPLIRAAGWLSLRHPRAYRALSCVIPPLRQLTAWDGWPRSVIAGDASSEAHLLEALRSGPYGRCVYKCDNDVVDHQIVLMEFEDGVSASFTMHGHSFEEGRTLRVDGSQATLLGKLSWNQTFLEIRDHRAMTTQRFDFPNALEAGGHGGGDEGLMQAFVSTLNEGDVDPMTSARASLESHLMAFAAEQARLEGRVIEMAVFRAEAERLGSLGSSV